jgi:hypothetical protein
MTFTAVLPPNIVLPEETWLPARVRRHGQALEISADEPALTEALPEKQEALKAWLARCSAQPVSTLSDQDLDDLRWQHQQEKHQL